MGTTSHECKIGIFIFLLCRKYPQMTSALYWVSILAPCDYLYSISFQSKSTGFWPKLAGFAEN